MSKKEHLIPNKNAPTAKIPNQLPEALPFLAETILDSLLDGILVLGIKNEVLYYNQVLIKLWKVPTSLLQVREGKKWLRYILSKVQNSTEAAKQFNLVNKDSKEKNFHILHLTSKKMIEWYSQTYSLSNTRVGKIFFFHDITEQSYFKKLLEYQAYHDALTGLPNRTLLKDRMGQAISIASRRGLNVAVIFFDLDRFKLINDSLSHQVGDCLLRAVSSRVSSLLRKEDTLARLSGDEFVVIIPELTKQDSIAHIAEKIILSFKQPFELAKRELIVTTSIGVSIYPNDGLSIHSLLQAADLAMYKAKENGGNQFKFYSAIQEAEKTVFSISLHDLESALKSNQFYLVYQAQFDLTTSEVLSLEAFIRWKHPEKGEILPLDFIPLAEETGLIVPIGQWVIDEACRQIFEWKEHGLPYIKVSLNLSAQQLKTTNFISNMEKILDKYQINPEYIEMEITENVILTYPEVIEKIKILNELKVGIVIDNFCSEGSNFDYFKDMHIDRFKISPKFVQNLRKDGASASLLETLITMTNEMNLKVIAKGVETKRQIDFLKNQHFHEVQGFLLSMPLLPLDVEKFFHDKQIFNNKTAKESLKPASSP